MRNKAIKNGLSKLENKDWFPFDTSDWINFDEFDGIGNKQSFIEEYGKYYRKNKRKVKNVVKITSQAVAVYMWLRLTKQLIDEIIED